MRGSGVEPRLSSRLDEASRPDGGARAIYSTVKVSGPAGRERGAGEQDHGVVTLPKVDSGQPAAGGTNAQEVRAAVRRRGDKAGAAAGVTGGE